MIVIGVMHIVNVPWNIPYLFPFFVFGYYLKNLDLKFSLWSNAVLVLLFVLGLCFWSPRYSPWNITHLAWKDDPFVIFIYAYRTALGVLGICVMGNFLKCLRTSLGEGSKFSKLMTDGGRETLGLYMLHVMPLAVIMRKVCGCVIKYLDLQLRQEYVNVVGYLLAPIVTMFTILLLLFIIRHIKSNESIRFLLGFKL